MGDSINLILVAVDLKENEVIYEVQRSDNDVDFEMLDFYSIDSTITGQHVIRFTDAKPFRVTYYRLVEYIGKCRATTHSVRVENKNIQLPKFKTYRLWDVKKDQVVLQQKENDTGETLGEITRNYWKCWKTYLMNCKEWKRFWLQSLFFN